MRSAFEYAAVVFLALCVALGVVIWTPSYKADGFVLLGLAITYRLWLATFRRSWRWFSAQDFFSPVIAYPLAYIAWFVLGTVDFVELPETLGFGAFRPMPSRVWWYAAAGLAAFLLGARSCISDSSLSSLATRSFRLSWNLGKLRNSFLLLLAITIAGWIYITSFMGIPALRLSALSEERPDTSTIPLYHWVSSPFWAAAYTVFFIALVRLWMGIGQNKGVTKLLRIVGLLLLLAVFVSSGGRAAFVAPFLTAFVLYHYIKEPIRLRRLTIILLTFFVLLSAYGFVRDLSQPDGVSDILADAGLPRMSQPCMYTYLYFRYSVATLRDVSEIIPAQVPFQHGVITTLPLQTLLPGHREMSDMYFKRLLGNEFVGQGQPATVLGPFYADFGVPGIIAGMYLWGVLLASLYHWMLRSQTIFAVMIYAWAMQAGLFGLFGGMFGYLDTLAIPMSWVVLNLYMRNRSQPDYPATPLAELRVSPSPR